MSSDASEVSASQRVSAPVPPPAPPPLPAASRPTSGELARRREARRKRSANASSMAIVSWIVGGGAGVAIAIGILLAISDSGSSRKRSSKNRTEQVAYAPSYGPSTAAPRDSSTGTRNADSRPGSTASTPKAPSATVRTAPKVNVNRQSIVPSFGGGSKNRKSDRLNESGGSVVAASASSPVVREPVPSPDLREAAEDRLSEVFQDEFAAATDEEAERHLALDLLRRTNELSDDSVAYFAALKMAYDLAIEAADPVLAENAVERMEDRFEIDEIAVRSHILFETEQAVRTDSWRIVAGCNALDLARLCVDEDRLDEARRLTDLALRHGEASKSAPLREAAAALQATLVGKTDVSTVIA